MPIRPPMHRPQGLPPPEQVARAYDRERGGARQRGYDGAWDKARKAYLNKHPHCVACWANGNAIPASDLDHIIPHRGDRKLFWDRSNWQGLCAMHHGRKTRAGG